MKPQEQWEKFLSTKRLSGHVGDSGDARTEFQRDFDRIVFSSAFRRLQDKTQVFPLAQNDYIRTRLTHSMEVSSVGRSLGTIVGERITKEYDDLGFKKDDFGTIVAAACLAHDIGNPPFGHTGEKAIQTWFKEEGKNHLERIKLSGAEKDDLLKFEGNAQGFRVLCRLQTRISGYGLDLTCATLGAFQKYPRLSDVTDLDKEKLGASGKKHGAFKDDQELLSQVAGETGMHSGPHENCWHRHPLAYLVEAADDICYHIIDLEDGFKQNRIDEKQALKFLENVITVAGGNTEVSGANPEESIEVLRGRAIDALIHGLAETFMECEDSILRGKQKKSLLDSSKFRDPMDKIIEFSRENIYPAPNVIKVEVAGFEVLGGLLSVFVPAALDVVENGDAAATKSSRSVLLMPKHLQPAHGNLEKDGYKSVLMVTDYVSGMTDSFAVQTFRQIMGITLPGGQ